MKSEFWESVLNWTYAMPLEHAYPLSFGRHRYEDPECDIVQSAAASSHLAETVRIRTTEWRHLPSTPEGIVLQQGMRILPRRRNLVIVRPFLHRDRSFTAVHFGDQVMWVDHVCKLILPDGKWYGQFGVKLKSGNFLPIDHGMFDYV